jgi:hypothetical protein
MILTPAAAFEALSNVSHILFTLNCGSRKIAGLHGGSVVQRLYVGPPFANRRIPPFNSRRTPSFAIVIPPFINRCTHRTLRSPRKSPRKTATVIYRTPLC